MHFGIRSSKHSNRSQQALNTSIDSRHSSQDDLQSNVESPANASAGIHSNSSTSDIQARFLSNRAQTQEFDSPVYSHPLSNASRSQLQQYPTQPVTTQKPPQYAAAAHESGFEDERPSIRKAAQTVLAEQKKSKSRSFFGLGSKSKVEVPSTTGSSAQSSPTSNPPSTLGRKISKRSKDQTSIQTSLQKDSSDQQYLSSPREEDSIDLDPYQIREPPDEHHNTQNPVLNQTNKPSVRLLSRDHIPPVDTSVSNHNLQAPQYNSNTPSSQTSTPSGLTQQNRFNTAKYADQQQASSPSTFVVPRLVQPTNSDAVSQLSQDITLESDFKSSPVRHSGQLPDFGTKAPSHLGDLPPRTSSLEPSQPSSPTKAMPSGQNRPAVSDGKPSYQTEVREVPPNYKQKFSGHGQSLQAPTGAAQGSYRGGPPQRESFQTGGGERGRETPPPTAEQPDLYKELLQKYKKVKGLYFEKTAQVEQLQNTIANQRLSHSRTALDDNEYSTRFNRLDGAINNLAFNIRKDWLTIPAWLCPFVNQDAPKVGTKEMTAVGRACISRWLNEEIFHRTFHPGLNPDLSSSLKIIESNIRKNSPPPNNQEESDTLTTKVVHWRLATLDGLSSVLSSPQSTEFKEAFTKNAILNLTSALISHLQDPAPAGVEGSAITIVELAVGIAANLPLESRDISVFYPMPNQPVSPMHMKIEPALPALENPGFIEVETEDSSTDSGSKDNLTEGQADGGGASSKGGGGSSKGGGGKEKSGKRNSMLGGLMGSKKAQSTVSVLESGGVGTGQGGSKEVGGRELVRFAGFVGVEVIGKSMLVKAPVWTT